MKKRPIVDMKPRPISEFTGTRVHYAVPRLIGKDEWEWSPACKTIGWRRVRITEEKDDVDCKLCMSTLEFMGKRNELVKQITINRVDYGKTVT